MCDVNDDDDENGRAKKPRLFITDGGRFVVTDDDILDRSRPSLDFDKLKNDPDYRERFRNETRGFMDIIAQSNCPTPLVYPLDPCYTIDPYSNSLSGCKFIVDCPVCELPVTGNLHSGDKIPIDAPISLGCNRCGAYFELTVSTETVISIIKEMERREDGE